MGVRWLDRRRRLSLVPFQWTHILLGAGLTTAQAESALWVVSPNGAKVRGAAAVCEVLDSLLSGHVFRWIYGLPLTGKLAESGYAFVARNRSKLPGVTPAVEQSGMWRTQRR